MKVCNLFWSMDTVTGLPGIMFNFESFPFDQVMQLLVNHPTVQDFFYNPFLFSLYDLWDWGRTRASAWYWVLQCRGQFDNIEYWV